MGRISGDKARFNRQRRTKIARRERMRALRQSLEPTTPAPPAPAPDTPR
jgi:hypothetical protein